MVIDDWFLGYLPAVEGFEEKPETNEQGNQFTYNFMGIFFKGRGDETPITMRRLLHV